MSKMKYFAVLAYLTLFASAASATCTRADLTGTWRFYGVFDDYASRCTLIMPNSGKTISSSSSCFLPEVNTSIPLSGNLSIASNCRLSGAITINSKKRSVDAWISSGKDSLSGMGWDAEQPFHGGTVTGVKQ